MTPFPMSALAAHLATFVPAVVQPQQDQNADGWWKWVALSLIGALVLSIGAFAVLIVRSFILDD